MLERGWLSSNSLLLQGDPRGAVLVDSGYCTHKEQTLALLREALGPGGALRLIVNTHLHSDHCGGNAHLAAAFGNCPIWIPPGHFEAARDWDEAQLSYRLTGQRCERFAPTRALNPGETLEQAGRRWKVLAAPGHDPHSLILFEPESGVLVSADALWEHGFGIVFPELEGETGFHEVERTLDLIETLPVRVVVPGHGSAFTDVQAALAEARSRLDFFRRNPERHTRHAAKALLVYHLLELGRCSRAELNDWLEQTPIHRTMWARHFANLPLQEWTETLLGELARGGTLKLEGDTISRP
ncbi:MBL fold metallo-hydrolase [Roseateles violae]|uniref:MBL fold metallo-hydrolase n=1 Tax=Roseateles violae TaxID=3058042 RepID=A0ABT8DYN6_9BURK|nr:MBL fold metallo-hydrolase [Pelomonas sp. PFR6]MDN3922698.1 MBL fold metallo-hydrolase [Pelomonas sp. PFR6]